MGLRARPTALVLLALGGCGTMNTARPLDQGEHAFSLTFGGPLLKFGGAAIPLPNAVVEGRSGLPPVLDRPLDLNYGINLTAATFGVVELHGGASWLLLDEQGARPALSVSDRLFFATNGLDRRKEEHGVWALDQVELTASWSPGQHLVYAGAAQYTDFSNPRLLLSPFVGTQLDFARPGGFGLQVEARYMGINALQEADTLKWVTFGRGAFAPFLGVSYTLPARGEEP